MVAAWSGGLDKRSAVDAVQRILESDTFARSPRSRDLLAFVTAETLDGRGHLLNQRVVARGALGRPASIDTNNDASARVQARRVRALLTRYYAEEGCDERLQVSIPVGQYGAAFARREPVTRVRVAPPTEVGAEPVVAVLQLRYGASGLPRRIAAGLTESIVHALARCPGVAVLGPLVPHPEESGIGVPSLLAQEAADYVLHGGVVRDDHTVRVTWHLSHAQSSSVVWTDTFSNSIGDFQGFSAEDDIVRHVVGAIGDFTGAVLRPRHGSVLQEGAKTVALRQFYSYMDTLDAAERDGVVASLTAALDSDPANAHVAACLAFTHAVAVLAVGAVAVEPLRQADDLARRALRIHPAEPTANNVMGIVALARSDLITARHHAERALDAAPMHPETAYMAGAVICGAGDWDRGMALIRDVIRINPYGPNLRRGWLAMDALMRDDPSAALSEASLVLYPGYLHGHVLRSICFSKMGLEELADDEMRRVLEIDSTFFDHPGEVLGLVPTVPRVVVEMLVANLPAR